MILASGAAATSLLASTGAAATPLVGLASSGAAATSLVGSGSGGLAAIGPAAGRIVEAPHIPRRGLLDGVLLPERAIRVWLPPGYDEDEQKRYPVLYVHDGQHVMARRTSWRDRPSWQLGDTFSWLLAKEQVEPAIVVMLDSVEVGADPLNNPFFRRRWLEYDCNTPVFGERYLTFVCDELKPAIDSNFRTLTGPAATSSLGSSMGGLCSFLLLWKRPETFGNSACLSPVFQAPLIADVAMRGSRLRPSGSAVHTSRLYIDNGGDADGQRVPVLDLLDGPEAGWWWLDSQLQPGVDGMRAALELHKVPFRYHRAPGARHNERAWARRVDLPLLHLYGKTAARIVS